MLENILLEYLNRFHYNSISMAIWHGEKGRKSTGGKISLHRKKRKYELGNRPTFATIGKEIRRMVKTKSGKRKVKLASAEFVNVLDKKSNIFKKVKILDVLENAGNPQFVRQKIVTKGCIVKTEIGNARVTSRPAQHGIVNAVLVKENKQ